MDEKIILKSNNDYAKKLKKNSMVCVISSIIIFVILLVFFNDNKYTILCVLDIIFFVASLSMMLFAIKIQKTTLTVSDRRVYGVTSFGKRVDLPLDSISAVGVSVFNGIYIGTSAGRIMFSGLGNQDEIHNAISKLLVERQCKEKGVATTIKQVIPQSNADEIKKYKDLLDSGIITQEEFDAKKKQLLSQ